MATPNDSTHDGDNATDWSDSRLAACASLALTRTCEHVCHAHRRGRLVISINPSGSWHTVKLWQVRTLKERARRWLHGSKGSREYRALRLLYDNGLAVPRPYGFLRFGAGEAFDECMVSEHIDGGKDLHRVLHDAITRSDSVRVDHLSAQVNEITRGCLELGLTDCDHRLSNFLVASDDQVYRIDLENARFHRPGDGAHQRVRMLSAMLTSYAWAAHRTPGTADVLADRLLDTCRIIGRERQRVLAHAVREINALVARTGTPAPFSGETRTVR